MDILHFVCYLSIDRPLGCFLLLSIVNYAAVNMDIQIICQIFTFSSFMYIPKIQIAGLYGNSMFNSLRNCHPVFHSDCQFTFQQQCTRILISPHPNQHLLFSIFDNCHSNGYEVLAHCDFNFHFSNNWCMRGFKTRNLIFKMYIQLFRLFIFSFIYFWLFWVFLAACGLSLVAESGEYSSLWYAGFHCGGFSYYRAQALTAQASVVVVHRLSRCDLRV